MKFSAYLISGIAMSIAGASVASDSLPMEASSDLLKEAERMVSGSQSGLADPSEWGMKEQATDTMNSIVIPEGEWPLEEMGVPTPGDYPYNLYIMISASMPDDLIRSYAFDAIQTGAKLVVRGIEPGVNIQEATQKWAKIAVRSDGASPGIIIDPRPFSTFEVDTVPAVVLSKKPVDKLCEQTKSEFSVSHDTAGSLGTLPFNTCLPAPESEYYKVTGNVSVPWVLKRMADEDAEPILQETAKAWFNVTPERYGVEPDSFGWAGPLDAEAFAKTSDEDHVRSWLEEIKQGDPDLHVIETEFGLGLGVRE